MPIRAGTRLGPYEVVAPLGAGGMGEVYRARDPRLGRDVAVKVLSAELTVNAERLARFEREARLLAGLSHAGIASIFGVEDAGGAPALVIELAGTYGLQGRLPEAEHEYKRAISMLVKTRGTDDRSIELARTGLAAVYRAQGRANEAELASAPVVRNLTTRYGPVVLRQRSR